MGLKYLLTGKVLTGKKAGLAFVWAFKGNVAQGVC